MKIILNSEDVENLQMFTSKLNVAVETPIQGISFKNIGGLLEMVATDARKMLIIKRKLSAREEMPEGVQIVLKLPNVKKGLCTISEKGGMYFLHNQGEDLLCPEMIGYPSYDRVIKNWESLPQAHEFAFFGAEDIKCLETIHGNFIPAPPKAMSSSSPHFWEYGDYKGKTFLIVLMPKT